MTANTIEHYLTVDGLRDPYMEWLRRMRDGQARIAVIRRSARIDRGHFGEHRFCRAGGWELRVDVGQGYRVYYGMSGQRVVLLLCGGDKRTQDADIERAVRYWQDWKRRV